MNIRRFLPSPSMGVALLALAVALGGTAYAANKIGTSQIKKNAITAPKIKKDAITTAKIKKDAVKSSKISDYSILKNGLRLQATDGPTVNDARSAAPSTRLLTKEPLRAYAKCFRDTSTNTLYGEIYARTKSDFSVMEGSDDLAGGPLATDYQNTDTPEASRRVDTQSVVGSGATYNEQETMMAAPNGPAVSMVTGIGVKNGAVLADGPDGPGDACIFQGGAFG